MGLYVLSWLVVPALLVLAWERQVLNLWKGLFDRRAQTPGTKSFVKSTVYLQDDKDGLQLRMKVWDRMGYTLGYMEEWVCPHCLKRGSYRSFLDDHMAQHLAVDGVRPDDLGVKGMHLNVLKKLGRLDGGGGDGAGRQQQQQPPTLGQEELVAKVQRLEEQVIVLRRQIKGSLSARAMASFEHITNPEGEKTQSPPSS